MFSSLLAIQSKISDFFEDPVNRFSIQILSPQSSAMKYLYTLSHSLNLSLIYGVSFSIEL